MTDLEQLRVEVRQKENAYYDALDAYQRAIVETWIRHDPVAKAARRTAALDAHDAYQHAQKRLYRELARRRARAPSSK